MLLILMRVGLLMMDFMWFMLSESVVILLLVETGSFRLYYIQHVLDLLYFLHVFLHQVSLHTIHPIQLLC